MTLHIRFIIYLSVFLIAMISLASAATTYTVKNNNGGLSPDSLGNAIQTIANDGSRVGSPDIIAFQSPPFKFPLPISLTGPYPAFIKFLLGSVTIAPASLVQVSGLGFTIFDFSGGGTLSATNLSLTGNVSIGANSALLGSLIFSGVNLTLGQGATVLADLNLVGALNSIIVSSGTATISGNMSGTGSFSLASGAGAVSLRVQGATLPTGNINVGANMTLNLSPSGNLAYAGNISGAGALSIGGANNVTLSGVNTYSGGTTIGNGANGTLSISAANQLGNVAGPLTFNAGTLITSQPLNLTIARAITLGGAATLNVSNAAATTTLSGIISGGGGLTKTGPGILVLSGANTYTGGTTVSTGTLQGPPTSIQGNIVNNSAVVFTAAGTYAGNMSGTGSFTKNNNGTLALSGTNTYNGGTTVNAGTLQGTTTSLQGNILNNAAVIINQAGAGTYAGNMSGTGSLTVSGGGTVTLSGANTHSGGTTISGSIVRISALNQLGSSTVTLTGGTLQTIASLSGVQAVTQAIALGAGGGILNAAGFTSEFSGLISGNGANALSITGGTVILSQGGGGNSYNGGTSVAAGATVQISAGNQLGNGSVTLTSSTLRASNTLTRAQTITLAGTGGTVDLAGGVTATLSGRVRGVGPLRVTNADLAGGSTLLLTTTNNDYTLGTSVGAGATLQIGNDGQLGDAAGGVTLGGSTLATTGTFTSTRLMTLGVNGGTFNVAPGLTTTLSGGFAGPGGLTKTNTGTLALTGATLPAGNMAISAGSLNLGPSANLTYAGNISGAGALIKSGAMTLILSGINTYTSGTLVSAGALQGTTTSLQGDIINNASVIFNQVGAGTYAGNMSGTGSLTVSGGTITLTGTNTHSGGTTLAGGILQASNNNQLGSLAPLGSLTFSGGALKTLAGITSARAITLGGAGGILDTNGFTSTFTGNMNGTAPLSISGGGVANLNGTLSGTMALSVGGATVSLGTVLANSYSGGTLLGANGLLRISRANQLGTGALTFSGGTLQTTASLTGAQAVTQAIALGVGGGILNATGFMSEFSGLISGANALSITGGTIILSRGAGNTYSGGTAISPGVKVQISAGNQLGTGAVTLTSSTLRASATLSAVQAIILAGTGGTVDLAGGVTATLSGPLSGVGPLAVTNTDALGSSRLILSNAANSFSSAVNIGGGVTLQISSDGQLGNIAGGLSLNGSTLATTATLSSARLITLGGGGGIFDVANGTITTLSGGFAGIGGLTTSGLGTLALTGASLPNGNMVIGAGSTLNLSPSAALSYAGSITGLGVLALGNSNLILTGSTYTTPTTIGGGNILELAPDIGLLTYSGAIGGSGSVAISGGNSVALTAANNYTGGTEVSGGTTLVVSNSNQLGSGPITVDDGTLDLTANVVQAIHLAIGGGIFDVPVGQTVTLLGALTGGGVLTKTGLGTLVIAGPSLSTGNIVINQGILNLAPSVPVTYAGDINGNGALTISNNTVTLTGTNTTDGPTTVAGGILEVRDDVQLGSPGNPPGIPPASVVLSGGILRITSSLTSDRPISLAGSGRVDINAGAVTTLTGAITELVPSHLFVTGAGILAPTNIGNNYSVGTSLGANVTLQISDNREIGSGPVTFNGGTLQAVHTAGTLTLPHTLNLIGPGTLTVLNAATTMALTNTITGAALLTMVGPGSFDLTALTSNTATGGMDLDDTTVFIDEADQLSSGDLTFNNGNLQTEHTAGTLTLPHTLNLIGPGTLTVLNAATTMALTNTITGAGLLTMVGPGSFDLTALTSNTATGGMDLDDTTVLIDAADQLSSGDLTFNNGNLQAEHTAGTLALPQALHLMGAGRLMVSNAAASLALTGSATGAGDFILSGPGSFDLRGFTNGATGTVAIDNAMALIDQASQLGAGNFLSLVQGTLLTTQGAAVPLTLPQNIALDANGGTVEVSTAGAVTTLSGLVSGGPLTVSGLGTVVLGNAGNSYNGTTINTGATLSITAAGHLGNPTGSLTLMGGTLNVGGVSMMGPRRRAALLSISQPVNLNGGGTFDVNGGQAISLDGLISGTGPLSIIGGGTVGLTNSNNSYTGGTEVSENSTLSISADAQLGDLAEGVTLDGAILQTTSTLTSARTFTLGPLGGFVDVAAAGTTTTFSNGIAGNGPLTKIGAGSLSLGGNSAASATTVSQGTFLLSGSLVSPVTVDAGAFFGGTGNITGDVINNGTLAPQGNLTINGGLTNTATSTYVCNVSPSGTSDHIDVTGDAQLDGSLQVVTAPGTYTLGKVYTILTALTSLNGTFSNILAPTGFGFQPSYANDQVKLTLTAIPSGPTPPPPPPPSVPPSRGVVQVLSNTGSVVATVVSSQISATGAVKVSHYDDGFHFSPVSYAPSVSSLPKRHASDRTPAYGEGVQSIFQMLSQKGPMALERNENRLWISPYYAYSRSDIDATTTATSRDEGILAGFDWRLLSPAGSLSSLFGFFVGGGAGKQTTPSSTPQDNTVNSKSVILGFYHSLGFWEDGRYDLIINGIGNRRRSKRFGDQDGVSFRADGSFNTYDITGNLSTSWVFHLPEQFSIRPNIGLAVSYSHQNPFTESNAGTFNQRYASSRKFSFEPYAGIGLRREWKSESYVVKLTGVVEQGYKIYRGNNSIRFFSTTGPVEGIMFTPLRAGSNSTHLTTYGSILDRDTHLKYILGYTATLQKHATSHTFTVKCEYRF